MPSFKYLANLGVKPTDDIDFTKYIRLLNIFSAFAFFSTAIVTAISLNFKLPNYVIIFSFSVCLGMLATVAFNYFRFFIFARYWLISVIYLGIIGITLMLGLKSHTQYFLIPAVATAILFFTNEKIWKRYFFAGISIPIWIAIELFFLDNKPFTSLDTETIESIRIIIDALLFTLVVFLCYILSKENNRQVALIYKQQDNLVAVNKNLHQFAYIVSHDLKAPLKNIYGFISMIQMKYNDTFNDELKRMLSFVEQQTKRMDSMITSILDYSRSNEKKGEIKTVSLNELLQDIFQVIEIPTHFKTTIPSEKIEIDLCETQLSQVLTNLISSAVKCNDKPYGEISVMYTATNTHHSFTVADNGPGVAVIDNISFTNNEYKSGIDLAIVKKLIAINGGQLEVKSHLGNGTQFKFTWAKEIIEPLISDSI